MKIIKPPLRNKMDDKSDFYSRERESEEAKSQPEKGKRQSIFSYVPEGGSVTEEKNRVFRDGEGDKIREIEVISGWWKGANAKEGETTGSGESKEASIEAGYNKKGGRIYEDSKSGLGYNAAKVQNRSLYQGFKAVPLRRQGFDNLFTIFVDNIPGSFDAKRLRGMFKQFGTVWDSFIPSKRRRNTYSRFGFVRFEFKAEAERAIKVMNGSWSHGNNLRVRMADYGWKVRRSNLSNVNVNEKKVNVVSPKHNYGSSSVLSEMKYSNRDAADGGVLTGSKGVLDEDGSTKVIEVLASRVAALEVEVARLKQALLSARSDGKLMNVHEVSNKNREGQQMEGDSGKQMDDETGGEGGLESTVTDEQQKEEEIGGEGRIVRISGEGFSDLGEIVNGRDIGDNLRSKSVKESEIASEFSGVVLPDFEENMNGGERGDELRPILARSPEIVSEDDGSVCESVGVTQVSSDQGGSCGSFSGEKWAEGSGEGRVTGGFDIFNATGVWGSKLGNHDAATIDSVKGIFVDSEDEDALEELELYRQYFEFSEDRKQKECSFSGMDKKPVSVEMEGDRKSCFSVNIRKRTKGQKKEEVETKKRRNYDSSRWMGVKQRYEHVWV